MVYALAKMHSGLVRAGYMYHIKYLHFFLIILSHYVSLYLSEIGKAEKGFESGEGTKQSFFSQTKIALPGCFFVVLVFLSNY